MKIDKKVIYGIILVGIAVAAVYWWKNRKSAPVLVKPTTKPAEPSPNPDMSKEIKAPNGASERASNVGGSGARCTISGLTSQPANSAICNRSQGCIDAGGTPNITGHGTGTLNYECVTSGGIIDQGSFTEQGMGGFFQLRRRR